MKCVLVLGLVFLLVATVFAETCSKAKDDYKECMRRQNVTEIYEIRAAKEVKLAGNRTDQPCYTCGSPCSAYCCYPGQYCCLHRGGCYCCV